MSKINLLPWREELRIVQNRVFFVFAGITILCSLVIIIIVGFFLDNRMNVESANIDYLNKEINGIKPQVTQIQGLQLNKKQLLNSMDIIRDLQTERFSIVKLLDTLPRVTPEGVYLTEVTRNESDISLASAGAAPPTAGVMPPNALTETQVIGSTTKEVESPKEAPKKEYHVTVQGVAQTNGSISILLKNLEDLKWLSDVRLSEVSINKTGQGLNFKVEFIQKLSGGA